MSSEEDKQSIKREVNWLCVIFNLQILISCICGIHFIIYEAYFLTTIFSKFVETPFLLKSKSDINSLKLFRFCVDLVEHVRCYCWITSIVGSSLLSSHNRLEDISNALSDFSWTCK